MSGVSSRKLSRSATRTGPVISNQAGPRGGPATLRRGTIYVAVLGVALIVGALGAAAIHVARIELHKAVTADEMARARLAAQSGTEYAISVINSNADWRNDYASGVPTTLADARNTLTGTGVFSFTFTDSGDGDLADEEQDSATLRSIGTAGGATSVVEVLLMPAGPGLDCLSSSLHSQGVLTVKSGTTLTTNQRVSANSNISATGGTIEGGAASTGIITGTVTVQPSSMNVSPPWEMPDPDEVFEFYKVNGTWIPVDSLSGGDSIREVLLSPSSNPFSGETNYPQGIYVVDCQGRNITLRECRIVGTLVLLNAGSGTNIKDSILMEPAIPNFPALMIEGPLEMDWSYLRNVDENDLAINLNPLGLPINGIVDAVLGGSWPGGISGLVYLTGNLHVKNQTAKVNGVVVVGGTVNAESRLSLTYNSTFYNTPPLGFAAGPEMQIVPGTWQRVAVPNP